MLSAAMGAIKYFWKISSLSFLFLSQFVTQEVRDRAAPTKNKIASFFMYLFIKGNKLQRKVPEQTSMQHQPNVRLKVFCSYIILV